MAFTGLPRIAQRYGIMEGFSPSIYSSGHVKWTHGLVILPTHYLCASGVITNVCDQKTPLVTPANSPQYLVLPSL